MIRKRYKILIILAIMGIVCMNGCQTTVSSEENKVVENGYMKISAEEAKEIMDGTKEFVLVDVREVDEYDEGHIQGALLIPYDEIEERAKMELADKEQLILVYCRSGRRSAIAAQSLVDLGYTNVKDFGGIMDWPYEIDTE